MRQKKVAVLIAMVMVFTGLLSISSDPVFADSTYSFTSSTINADGTRTAKFKCNGMVGLCAEAGAFCTYSGKAKLSRMKNTHNAVYCAYYYGYEKGWTSGSNGHKLARLLSYCMGNGTGGDYKTSTMKSLLETAKKKAVPSGFECYLCKPTGSSKQDFIVWRYPSGKLEVVKKSGNTSISNNGTYTLAGITIKVYSDSACKTCVKTLTTKKNGKTGGKFSLKAGTYYVKETSVPAVTGYKATTKVYKIKVPANGSGKVTVTNQPDVGSITVQKVTEGEGGDVSGFTFAITNTSTKKSYTVTTNGAGTAKVSSLPFGKYTITEKLTKQQIADGYTDETGTQTRTIAKNSTPNVTVTYKNRHTPPTPALVISKETDDDGPVAGFKFKISYHLSDNRTLTEEDLIAEASPQVGLTEEQSLGAWSVKDPDVLDRINSDAKDGKTGTYDVRLMNVLTTTKTADPAEGADVTEASEPEEEPDPVELETEDASTDGAESSLPEEEQPDEEPEQITTTKDIEITVRVRLVKASEADQKEERKTESGGLEITSNDITFAGSASIGEMTGTTGSTGIYRVDDVQPGHYVIEEIMTDLQLARYRKPGTQEVTITENDSKAVVFSFENEAKQIPVKLKKESLDHKISEKEFTLNGTIDFSGESLEEITVKTDANGIADFGKLYPGTYVVEESDFDVAAYSNAYPMEGKSGPAFAFKVTGDELTKEEVEAGKCLWLGGDAGSGSASEKETSFLNIPYVDLPLTKIDGETMSFLPGATFELKDSSGALAARFRLTEDEDGLAFFEPLETNGVITGEAYMTGESAQEEDAEEETEQPQETEGSENQDQAGGEDKDGIVEKNCIVLHGLLPEEKYTLTETEAPKGYCAGADAFVFSITIDDQGNQIVTSYKDEEAETLAGGIAVIVNFRPEIGTTALDSSTKEHIAEADEKAKIIDHCAYKNLMPGETYTLLAYLMDKAEYQKTENIDDVKNIISNGKKVVGTKTFTAKGTEGEVKVPISLSASELAGKTTVVYEYLFIGEPEDVEATEEEAICEETDPSNDEQTVVFPEIGTKASHPSKNMIEDEVSYSNLIPGRDYVIYGRLMNKDTGKSTGLTASQKFKASDTGSGTVTVKFPIDMKDLLDHNIRNLVVFERCYIVTTSGEEKKVGSHEDLKDKGQTINLPVGSIRIGDRTPSTGDPFKASVFIILMMIAGTVSAAAVYRHRRKHSESEEV